MGNNTTNLEPKTLGSNPNLLQASYSGYADYNEHIDLGTYDHVFSADVLFPDLGEHERLKANYGLNQNDLSFSKEALATLEIVNTTGGFKNVIGHYSVSSNGTINNVTIAFKNTRSAESGLTHNFNITGTGESVNFFMVANGYALNKEFAKLEEDQGSFHFIYKNGGDSERPAKITDHADDITLIYQAGDGEISKIRGPVYHSTSTEDDSAINTDQNIHVVSGVIGTDENESLRIGFEDFPGLGDADFNDVIFDLSVSYLTPHDTVPNSNANSLADIIPSSGNSAEERDNKLDEIEVIIGENDLNSISPGTGMDITLEDVVTSPDQVDESIANFINLNKDNNLSDTPPLEQHATAMGTNQQLISEEDLTTPEIII